MAALAQLVRLSRYYFCRSFKRSFGFLPRGYRIGLRIEARPEGTRAGQASAEGYRRDIDFVATGGVPGGRRAEATGVRRRLIGSSLVSSSAGTGISSALGRLGMKSRLSSLAFS